MICFLLFEANLGATAVRLVDTAQVLHTSLTNWILGNDPSYVAKSGEPLIVPQEGLCYSWLAALVILSLLAHDHSICLSPDLKQ